jgi:hypothetical protein
VTTAIFADNIPLLPEVLDAIRMELATNTDKRIVELG